MKNKICISTIIASIILSSCTENPFLDISISEDSSRQLSGTISVEKSIDQSGVFVWLYELNISTWTDNAGNFTIILPKISEGGSTENLTIYYFVANYELQSSSVFLENGLFKYGEADLNDKGKIKDTIYLKKLISIETSVNPTFIDLNNNDSVKITTKLTLEGTDPLAVSTYYNNRQGYWSGIFIRSISDPDMEILRITDGSNYNETLLEDTLLWKRSLFVPDLNLEPGIYAISPYLRITSNLPSGLIKPKGIFDWGYSDKYFDLPLIEKTAIFEVSK